jgi:hypothetical protein
MQERAFSLQRTEAKRSMYMNYMASATESGKPIDLWHKRRAISCQNDIPNFLFSVSVNNMPITFSVGMLAGAAIESLRRWAVVVVV